MPIESRRVQLGRTELVEYSRPGVDTVYQLHPERAAEVDRTRDEMSKWRLVKAWAICTRQKRKEE